MCILSIMSRCTSIWWSRICLCKLQLILTIRWAFWSWCLIGEWCTRGVVGSWDAVGTGGVEGTGGAVGAGGVEGSRGLGDAGGSVWWVSSGTLWVEVSKSSSLPSFSHCPFWWSIFLNIFFSTCYKIWCNTVYYNYARLALPTVVWEYKNILW